MPRLAHGFRLKNRVLLSLLSRCQNRNPGLHHTSHRPRYLAGWQKFPRRRRLRQQRNHPLSTHQ